MRAQLLVLLVCLTACDNATPGAGSGSAASGSAKAASKSASASVSAKPAASSATPATSAAPSASAAVGAGPDLVFEGLKVVPGTPADPKDKLEFKSIEVKPDGSVVADDGKSKLQFAKNEIKDDKGNTLYAVGADGTITGKGVTETLKFNEKDEIVSSEGRIYIENGIVKFEDKSKGTTEDAPIKLEGVTEKNRRAALLLVAAMFFASGDESLSASPSASTSASAGVPSAVSAPPKAPAPSK